MRTTSRSSTTTAERAGTARRSYRLPTHRPPTHPGEMLLEEFLRPLGISQSAFANRIGVSFPRLNDVIHGRRAITADTALRLERALEMPAEFWLNLQARWELWHVLHGPGGGDIRAVRPVRRMGRSARSRRS